MLKARKKNRVVWIPDEKADEYKKLGYILSDEDGKTIYQPEDKDATIESLRKANNLRQQRIAEMELMMKQKAPHDPSKEPEAKPSKVEDPAGSNAKAKGSATKDT